MSATNDPYSRLYWSVMDDPKFDGIREDCRVFGAWSLMLVVADMAWPAPAYVPPHVPRAAVARLATVELIDLLSGNRFRIHGLDAEREKRSLSARNAAASRWQSGRSPTRDADPLLDETETRHSRDEAAARPTRNGLPYVTPAVTEAWEKATGTTILASGAFALGYLDDACRRHPEATVVSSIGEARRGFAGIPSTQQLAAALRALLDPFRDPKAVKADDAARAESERSRKAVEATLRRSHGYGGHEAEAHPRCPLCQESAA